MVHDRIYYNKAPPPDEDWLSASKLHQAGAVGGNVRLSRLLAVTRDLLIEDRIALQNISYDEAVATIDREMVGERKPARGPIALYASPALVSMLEKSGHIRYRSEEPPPPATGWKSALTLTGSRGNSLLKTKSQIASLRDELVNDIITATGQTPEEADELVEDILIGVRRLGTTSTVYVSPDAQRMLQDFRRDDGRSRPLSR